MVTQNPGHFPSSLISVNEKLHRREAILNHENLHVKQMQSADVLLFEMVAIVNLF